MPTLTYTASAIMDEAAVLLNDANRTKFSYAVQLPYLRIAYQELEDLFAINGFKYEFKKSASVTSVAGSSSLTNVPTDLLLPLQLEERLAGSSELFTSMNELQILPVLTNTPRHRFWNWNAQVFAVPPATTNRDINIYYFTAFTAIVNETTGISINHVKQFLSGRTASICAVIIDENFDRGTALDTIATAGVSRALGINAKKKQALPTRRRPFRAFH